MVKKRALFNINIVLLTFYLIYGLYRTIILFFEGGDLSPEYMIFLFMAYIGIIISYFIILSKISSDYKKQKASSIIYIIGELINCINWIWYSFGDSFGDINEINLPFFIMAPIILITGIIYFIKIRNSYFEKKITAESLRKLNDLIKTSTRIKLESIQNILNLDDKSFDEKIIEWAKEFNFKIDGEYLVVNEETVSDFINKLDDQFAKWEQIEKDKIDKL